MDTATRQKPVARGIPEWPVIGITGMFVAVSD
jgi:hypothetical protein